MTISKLIKYDAVALIRLSFGTAITIAFVLTLPDLFAFLANSNDLSSWILKITSSWLQTAMLWFVGYFIIVYIYGIFARGITVSSEGLKLWRWGKIIPWDSIIAFSLEQELLFSRLFFQKPPVSRLTLYIRKDAQSKICTQPIPSFWFDPGEFNSLWQIIAQKSFAFNFASNQLPQAVLVSSYDQMKQLKKTYGFAQVLRVLVSLTITIGLTLFFVRKATENYLYNIANISFTQGNYHDACAKYRLVTTIDPLFALAWQNLGNVEFELKETENACRDWQKALTLKPDLILPKVGLACVYINRREFDKSYELLMRALNIDPMNTSVLTNLAALDMCLGHTRKAVNKARLILTIEPENQNALCLLVQGKIRQGKAQEALQLFQHKHKISARKLIFCQLVEGEIYLALNKLDEAEILFQNVLASAPNNEDALLDMAAVKMAQKKWDDSKKLLLVAAEQDENNPWIWIAMSNLHLAQGQLQESKRCFADATILTNQDSRTLASEAKLALALNMKDRALSLASKSIYMDPETPDAIEVFKKCSLNHKHNFGD